MVPNARSKPGDENPVTKDEKLKNMFSEVAERKKENEATANSSSNSKTNKWLAKLFFISLGAYTLEIDGYADGMDKHTSIHYSGYPAMEHIHGVKRPASQKLNNVVAASQDKDERKLRYRHDTATDAHIFGELVTFLWDLQISIINVVFDKHENDKHG